MTTAPHLRRLLLLTALLTLPALGQIPGLPDLGSGSSTCDPSRSSCAPTQPPIFGDIGGGGGGGAGGSCKPNAGGNPCDSSGPASQGSTGGPNLGAGNPINVTNGNKYQMEVDMPALPGELGLELVRHYNSAHARVLGALGAGWRLSYETELYEVGNTVQVLQADGSRIIFAIDPANPNHCASGDPTQGHIAIDERRSANGQQRKRYTWHWSHGPHAGRSLHFNAQGKLERISAASGATLTLQRSPNGQLAQVTDPQGRSLIFSYPDKATIAQAQTSEQPALFAGVQAITTPLGRFTYQHGTQKSDAANLLGVTSPDQTQRHYHYEDKRWPYRLSGISMEGTDSSGQRTKERLSTYRYDERGRAILSTKGAPPEGTPGQEQVTLQYLAPTLPAKEGRTLLTNSLGQHTLYRQRIIAGQYRLTEARGAGCAQCGPVNIRYHYDSLGRLTAQDTLAPTTIEENQEPPPARTLHTRRIGQAQEQVYYEDRRWPDKPTRITRPSVVQGQQQQLTLRYNAAGQITQLTQQGFSPINDQGQQQPTAIERTTRYRYEEINGRSLLVQVDGPLASSSTRIQWDARGDYMVQITSPGGYQHHLQHDRAGRLTQVRNDAGFATHWAYDSQSRITHLVSTGPGGQPPQVRTYRYNALGQMVESGTGQPADQPPPPALAELLQNAPAYTPALARQFDSTGRLIWQASALGLLHTRSYDSESRPTASGQHSNRIARTEAWRYNDHGQITHWSDNAGRFAHIDYDSQGRPLTYHDSTGRSIQLPGNSKPRPAAAPGVPAAQTASPTRWQDDFGRTVLTADGQHGRHTLAWDAADRLIAMHDAQGNHARYAYDSAGRITEQHIHSANGANSAGNTNDTPPQTTRWHYQGRHLLAVEHPTQTERYRYDHRGLIASRSVTRTTANGQSTTNTNNTTSHTRYLHDSQGRLAATSLPDGRWLHYQRNGQGQVTALVRSPVQRPWLRKLAAEDAIASHLQRNLAGLQSYTAGNGIHSQWLRDGTGTLAGIVHSRPSAGPRQLHAQSRIPTPLWPATASVVQRLLGIGNAQASTATHAPSATTPATLAFFDERYLWSGDGLLLHSQRRHQGAAQQRYWAYDSAGQLVAGVQTSTTADTATDTQVWRYAYQDQRRVLAQQTASQDELMAGTSRTDWDEQGRPGNATYNANGQPTGQGQRSYQWNALGRLTSIHAGETTRQEIARYHYDHRGLRIAKDTGGRTTGYLYSADRHLLAELNASGHIQRQYIYLADLLLAVIDTPKGAKLAQTVEPGIEPLEQTIGLWADVKALLSSYLPGNAILAYIHSNHLGAPEAVTNENGELLWQASYAPFGAAAIQTGPNKQKQQNNFILNIRLPGQYLDEETGLHYNRQRYYDPAQGAYLTPDPLGHPDGPNAYAYVANNPLGWIDPDGLVLFAFDGTGNSDDLNDPAMIGGNLSNVWKFKELYRDGAYNYVTGVGTVHRDQEYENIIPDDFARDTFLDYATGDDPLFMNDMGGNYSGPARIDRMMLYMRDQADEFDDEEVMDIDIIGFSRGASQARDFSNRITASSLVIDGKNYYKYLNKNGAIVCQWVNFRFMGLFDTVLSTNRSDLNYNLGIPSQFQYVAHAVALNEHRSGNLLSFSERAPLPHRMHWGGFPLESIGASSNTPGAIRIELGFLGSHADIGGGFADDELSKVALAWMIEQAKTAGVVMDETPITVAGSAVLHDKSNNIQTGQPVETCLFCSDGEDRRVNGAVRDDNQRQQRFGTGSNSMVYTDTQNPNNQFITYRDRNTLERYTEGPFRGEINTDNTGTVDMNRYISWLKGNGYQLNNLQVK